MHGLAEDQACIDGFFSGFDHQILDPSNELRPRLQCTEPRNWNRFCFLLLLFKSNLATIAFSNLNIRRRLRSDLPDQISGVICSGLTCNKQGIHPFIYHLCPAANKTRNQVLVILCYSGLLRRTRELFWFSSLGNPCDLHLALKPLVVGIKSLYHMIDNHTREILLPLSTPTTTLNNRSDVQTNLTPAFGRDGDGGDCRDVQYTVC